MGSALEALVRITKKALGSVTYDGPVYVCLRHMRMFDTYVGKDGMI